MSDERTMILRMLAEGKISVEEADALLDALGEPEVSRPEGEPTCCGGPRSRGKSGGGRGRRETFRPFFDFGFDFPDFGMDIQGMAQKALHSLREGLAHGVNLGDWFETSFGASKHVEKRELSASSQGMDRLVVRNRPRRDHHLGT